MTCKTCKFFDALENEKIGLCRQRAPSLVYPDGIAKWPMTRPEEWCGDFEENKFQDMETVVIRNAFVMRS